jgi:hypothetical protein
MLEGDVCAAMPVEACGGGDRGRLLAMCPIS